jgi:hypothetical protein
VSSQSQAQGSIDSNPQPRDNVRDGGDLRLPLTLFPSNFNINQVDGPGDASVTRGTDDRQIVVTFTKPGEWRSLFSPQRCLASDGGGS